MEKHTVWMNLNAARTALAEMSLDKKTSKIAQDISELTEADLEKVKAAPPPLRRQRRVSIASRSWRRSPKATGYSGPAVARPA